MNLLIDYNPVDPHYITFFVDEEIDITVSEWPNPNGTDTYKSTKLHQELKNFSIQQHEYQITSYSLMSTLAGYSWAEVVVHNLEYITLFKLAYSRAGKFSINVINQFKQMEEEKLW